MQLSQIDFCGILCSEDPLGDNRLVMESTEPSEATRGWLSLAANPIRALKLQGSLALLSSLKR